MQKTRGNHRTFLEFCVSLNNFNLGAMLCAVCGALWYFEQVGGTNGETLDQLRRWQAFGGKLVITGTFS